MQISCFYCGNIVFRSGHCELSDIELRDLKPGLDFVQQDSYWLFSWDFTNPKCYTSPTFMPPAGKNYNFLQFVCKLLIKYFNWIILLAGL